MEEFAKPTNFIEDIIDADLKSGKHTFIATRFPPEPNGYLHIGHAKAVCINFGIKEKYHGTCNLRFDDTNPSKEDVEYVNSIQEDIRWLGFEWDALYYASDYFEKMYSLAEGLIEKGLAYVCDLSAEEISKTRGTLTEPGVNSPYRDRSVEENLRLFREMRAGKYDDGEKVLRAKIDMAANNINMRDPVIYRIVKAPHHRQGTKWVIYPMYDFAHPLEDAIEGITHSCCSLEFEDHRPLYDWVVEKCGFNPRPRQIEFARLNLTHTIMSKRYLRQLVEDGVVEGWNDPRMPTLSGMRERGYPAEAIRDFCSRIGVAKANSVVDIALLEHCVRENLNENATRAMAVLKPLKLVIENYPEGATETVEIENNPQQRRRGNSHRDFQSRTFHRRKRLFAESPRKIFPLKTRRNGKAQRLVHRRIRRLRRRRKRQRQRSALQVYRRQQIGRRERGHQGQGRNTLGERKRLRRRNCKSFRLSYQRRRRRPYGSRQQKFKDGCPRESRKIHRRKRKGVRPLPVYETGLLYGGKQFRQICARVQRSRGAERQLQQIRQKRKTPSTFL